MQHAELCALGDQGFRRGAGGLPAGAHDDDHPFRIGGAVIFGEVVGTAGAGGEAVHRHLHDGGQAGVKRADGFARLEEGIRVMGGAADEWPVGRQSAGAVGAHQVIVDHGADVGVIEQVDAGDFVRGAEAVEEMQERHPALQGGGLGDEREIMRFLHRGGGEQGETGGAGGHDV